MRYLLLVCCCLPALLTSAQLRTDDDALPEIGDTVYFAEDNLPVNFNMAQRGPDNRWDYTILQAPFAFQVQWEDARPERFAGAQLKRLITEQTTAYYRRSANALELVGMRGYDPFGIGIQGSFEFEPAYVERAVGSRLQEENSLQYGCTFTVAAEDIYVPLFENLPMSPDSFRIQMRTEETRTIDASGQLIIPGGIYQVRRQKRIGLRNIRLEVKVGNFEWQDVTRLLPGNDIFGLQRQVQYYFFSDDAEQAITIVEMNAEETQVTKVIYRADPESTRLQDLSDIRPGIYAFPNPAIVNVRFEFLGLEPGTYELTIRNILGQPVWNRSFFLAHNRTEKVNISMLKKGTYLYSLKDGDGNIITTRRLVVVRP